MPQCAGGGWRSSDVPYGKGSLHSELLEATFRRRRRAAKINDGENGRLRSYRKMVDHHQHAEKERTDKAIARVRKTVENLEAYKQVLQSYRADKFDTLKWGFKPRLVNTPNSFRRYQLENKVYTCGFSLDTLYPEVEKVIYDSQPHRVKEESLKRMLAVAKKRSDFVIDRKITDAAMKNERKGKKVKKDLTSSDIFATSTPENTDVAIKSKEALPRSPKSPQRRVILPPIMIDLKRSKTKESGTRIDNNNKNNVH